MTQKLLEAIEDLISTHSASQLIPYENLLREAFNLMQLAPLADIEDALEEIGIAKAENAAYMNGVAEGDNEPDDFDWENNWPTDVDGRPLEQSEIDEIRTYADWEAEQLDLPF